MAWTNDRFLSGELCPAWLISWLYIYIYICGICLWLELEPCSTYNVQTPYIIINMLSTTWFLVIVIVCLVSGFVTNHLSHSVTFYYLQGIISQDNVCSYSTTYNLWPPHGDTKVAINNRWSLSTGTCIKYKERRKIEVCHCTIIDSCQCWPNLCHTFQMWTIVKTKSSKPQT